MPELLRKGHFLGAKLRGFDRPFLLSLRAGASAGFKRCAFFFTGAIAYMDLVASTTCTPSRARAYLI